MRPQRLIIPLLLAVTAATHALAQSQPSTAPTTTRARRAMTLPPGFKLIEVAGRRVVAEPADEPWIRTTLANLASATRPTTAPADLVQRLATLRPDLSRQMAADLPLPDPAKLDPFFDKLAAHLERFRDLKPPVFYLVTTRAKLLAVVKAGWEDPRYHYNRAADDVLVDTGLFLSADGPMDDMLLPAVYKDDAPPDARAAALTSAVQRTERLLTDEIARQAQAATQVAFITFLADELFRPLDLKPGQTWFGVGAAGVLGAHYASPVLATPEHHLLDRMTFESPRLPVKTATVDLIQPLDLSVLRDQIVPFYLDATRRKSTTALRHLTDKSGIPGIAKVTAAIKQSPPADGPALLQLIQRETSVDLTPLVRPAKP